MSTNSPLVSISLVVKDGAKYIRGCLGAVFRQTYPNIEVVVWDNNSSDETLAIIEKEFPHARLIRSEKNFGFEGGQNANFKNLKGDHVVFLCVDVFLDKDFVKAGVEGMERDPTIGALQAKILVYNSQFDSAAGIWNFEKTNIIDTTGFQIFRSRRVVNRGHGEEDRGQYNTKEEIFSYEGAAGFFRRKALEDARINGYIFDEDFWWYASDLDLGWRMRLLGWKSMYIPQMLAWHERQTTRRLSNSYPDFIRLRRTVPAFKRALDYRNTHFTILKNDFFINLSRDVIPFFLRETQLFIYTIFFEPRTILSWISFFRLSPKMIKKRKLIMKRRKASPDDMRRWFL